MKKIKLILGITAFAIAGCINAQETGIIKGTITDDKGETLLFVPVALMEDSTIVAQAETNEQGDFTFKQLTPGIYNLKFSYTGYKTLIVSGIEVTANQISYVYRSMKTKIDTLGIVEVVSEKWEKSIINPRFSTVTSISIDQIENSAVGFGDIISLMITLVPGIQPTEDGKDIYMRGSRQGSTGYYVDGNRTMSVPEVPGPGIASMEILTGGVPAEYGDCTGGLVIITTKEYKWEMRKKEIQRRERAEREQQKNVKKKKID
ncbi:MAG: hypothetical protein A3F72_00550 [Bacteroidetes bacterium RIFCSPLOWO2_12_FULL_35_15]|nr:MAG: hypothetical protein A3F72_00550 [Bacteroidetes bacterium RIFCSPLOWO2_12_FULL_35_15]